MWPSPRRLLSALGAILIAFVVSGCDVVAELDVRSESHVEVAMVINESGRCEGLTDFWGLRVEPEGSRLCRATGTLDLTAAAQGRFLTLSRIGEYYLLELRFPEDSAEIPIDLTVRFPGMVVDAGGGLVSGNSVHFPKEYGLGAVGEIRVVALNHIGPPLWVIGTVAGLLLGALVAVGVLLGSGRHRPVRPTAMPDETLDALPLPDPVGRVAPAAAEPAEAAVAPRPPPAPAPVDPSVWAPPGYHDPATPEAASGPADRPDR